MSSAITSLLQVVPFPAPGRASTAAAPQRTAPTTTRPTDTVQLSVAQHVRQLHAQGESAAQIASNLGLSVVAVNSYLATPKAA